MRTTKGIISIIKDLKEEVERKYKAEIIGIFGSYARGEQKKTSDVDILVRFHENATLFDFIGLSIFLQEKLGIDVDVVPQDAIRKELKKKISQEVIIL